jgi:hypothetical protein
MVGFREEGGTDGTDGDTTGRLETGHRTLKGTDASSVH